MLYDLVCGFAVIGTGAAMASGLMFGLDRLCRYLFPLPRDPYA